MTNVVIAEQVVDIIFVVGFRVSTLTANTPQGRDWLAKHSVVGRYSKTILIDSYRVPEFSREIERYGLTVSRITGGQK